MIIANQALQFKCWRNRKVNTNTGKQTNTNLNHKTHTQAKPKNTYSRVRDEVDENKIEASRSAAAAAAIVNWPKIKKIHIE